jgi:hypothetical protein
MVNGILLTVAVELCLLVTYIYFRAKKELKEEERPITDEHFFI